MQSSALTIFSPPDEEALRSKTETSLSLYPLAGVSEAEATQVLAAHIRPSVRAGYKAKAVVDTMRDGLQFAVANGLPSMKKGIQNLFNQYLELSLASSVQFARADMVLKQWLTIINSPMTAEQADQYAKQALKLFSAVQFDDKKLSLLKSSMADMAQECLPVIGVDNFVRQEADTKRALEELQACLQEEAESEGHLRMLEAQHAFFSRTDVAAEVWQKRIEQLGKTVKDMQLAKDAVPPNTEEEHVHQRGWFIFSWSSSTNIRVNNDQKRAMYQVSVSISFANFIVSTFA